MKELQIQPDEQQTDSDAEIDDQELTPPVETGELVDLAKLQLQVQAKLCQNDNKDPVGVGDHPEPPCAIKGAKVIV